jgi:anti-sigma factor RsiW
MKVTREVIKDLLAVYLAGDASGDSRAVVEEWLRSDPELAAQVAEARRIDFPVVAAPPPTAEKRALDRTRRYMLGRSIVLGAAIYFSSLPLSFKFDSGGFRGLFLDDWLGRSFALAVAAVLWAVYWRMSRGLKVSGH